VVRASYVVGAFSYNRDDLERYKARNEKVKISVVGVCNLASDIPPTLAVEVVDSIKVYGIFQASTDVKEALSKAGKIL
jgi:hypothetical protein